MNNYKSFSELKEELGNNYDFKLYEMGISALKEIENLQQENKQLKDNQVRALNKIRDFINNANCELQESKYSNDNHGLYWELFKKNLTNIQKLIKGINNDEYVTIPKYREKELLNLEDNWDKLKKYIKTEIPEDVFINTEWFVSILDKMQELEQGSDKK